MNDSAAPDASVVPDGVENYLHDPQLAIQLTRLASLQGHAVPSFRFGMVEKNRDGVPIAELPRHMQAMELWRVHFSQADVAEVSPGQMARSVFPLLWVSKDGAQVLVLRGQLSAGQCAAEDHEGKSQNLDAQALTTGRILMLKPSRQTQAGPTVERPSTAGDWFVYVVRQYRHVFFDAVLATFVISVVGLVGAMFAMQVYDRVVPTKGYSTLVVLAVGALLGIVLELTLKQVRAHLVDRACKAIDQDLASVFFGKALDIRMDARPRTVGTFASQIRYFESVRNFLTSSSLFILADTPFAIFFIAVIAMISWPVAMVPLVVLPLAIVLGLWMRKPIEDLTAMHMAESNRKNGLLIEAIDGIESIKACNAEWKLLDRWRQLTATIATSELKSKALTTLSTNLTQFLQQIVYVGMIVVGAYQITQGSLSMGGLLACTIISGRALAPFAMVPNMIVQWKQAQVALKGLDAIMAMPSDRDPQQRLVVPQTCEGRIKLENTTFAYGPGQPSLQVADCSIGAGERIAILGAVGSGKSTLLKLLSGLYKPQQGTVQLDGIEVEHLAPEFVREHIGYLPQDVRLYQGTLRENLTLGLPSPSDSQILRAAAMTGLDRVIQSHPKGLALEIAEGGRGLSGGQRQLVGLTRLLLQQPRIMLLDEPTASMDNQLEARVMKHLFEEMPAHSAVVVVTHKPALLAHVSRVLVVDQGRVVMDGPRDAVLARLRGATPPAAPAPAVSPVNAAAPSLATARGQA